MNYFRRYVLGIRNKHQASNMRTRVFYGLLGLIKKPTVATYGAPRPMPEDFKSRAHWDIYVNYIKELEKRNANI